MLQREHAMLYLECVFLLSAAVSSSFFFLFTFFFLPSFPEKCFGVRLWNCVPELFIFMNAAHGFTVAACLEMLMLKC